MPDFKQRISELERHVADLKVQHAAGQISTDAYVDQAGRLRFTNDADGRTWWLDPNKVTLALAALIPAAAERQAPG